VLILCINIVQFVTYLSIIGDSLFINTLQTDTETTIQGILVTEELSFCQFHFINQTAGEASIQIFMLCGARQRIK